MECADAPSQFVYKNSARLPAGQFNKDKTVGFGIQGEDLGTLFGALGRIVPFAIIAGLLAADLLIEPKATGLFLPESLIGPRDRFYGVATAGGSAIWLAGSNGKILRSDDGGTSWRARK